MTNKKRMWCVIAKFEGLPEFIISSKDHILAETELEAERLFNNMTNKEKVPFYPEEVTEKLIIVAFIPGQLVFIADDID